MPSYMNALLITLLATSVTAAPATIPSNKLNGRSFKVERVRNANFAGHDGTAALVKAYRKWGMELPAELAEGLKLKEKHRIGDGTADFSGLLGALGLGNGGGDSTADENGDEDGNINANVAGSGNGEGEGSAKSTDTGAAATTQTTGLGSAATSAPSSDGTGEVTATPEPQDVEFLSPVEIGGQTLNMDFDSGSSDLWVFNTQLSRAAQAGHTNFDPSKSDTFAILDGASFSISYGDGSGAEGIVGTDTVNIGGATVTGQAIELATAVSDSFVNDKQSNGLVGLAFSKLNTVKPVQQNTFFDNAIPTLAEPVFTADLKAGAVGSYEFGQIDSSKFEGELSWAPINTTNGFWQFSSEKFSIDNGTPINEAGGQAIADTGTTLMLVNAAVVNAYYGQVSGAVNNATLGGVTFPCDSQLPDLQVDIGGNYMANVPGNIINFAKVDAAGQTCFGGLQATTSDLQIYGDILFKAQFVAFNGGNNSIGMAAHN